MSEDLAYQRAEKAALRLIARAEQCSGGLARKLEKRGCTAASVSAVILQLCELDLLNDRRYARLWLQSRLRFTRTPRRLLSSLCVRGIHRDDAHSALKEVLNEDVEIALLARFAEKHVKKIDACGKGFGNKIKIKYLLKNEGFSTAAIHRFMEID